MSRKVFNYNDMTQYKTISKTSKANCFDNSISACGCLFYKIYNNELYLLLISYADPKWPKLDDFGGQIDSDDNSVLDAIIRETSEESNNLISEKIIKKLLINNKYETFYNKTSKYYNFAIKVDNDFFHDTKVFGVLEKTDNIKRTISWYKYNDVKSKISLRIAFNNVLITYLLSECKLDNVSNSESKTKPKSSSDSKSKPKYDHVSDSD